MKPNASNNAKPTERPSPSARRAAAKKKRSILIFVVALAVTVAAIVLAIVLSNRKSAPEITQSTKYSVDEVTYGNVNVTISGSGMLTPITKETLSALDLLETEAEEETTEDETTEDETSENESTEDVTSEDESASDEPTENESETNEPADAPTAANTDGSAMPDMNMGGSITVTPAPVIIDGIVDDLKVTVGDTVTKGEVIAIIVSDGITKDLLAPYDAVILELYIREGQDIADDTSVAMFMGTDGYTMSISVDENNISTVQLGQEVEIKIDVVGGTSIGSVTDISYNGSTGGSSTYYQIEVTFDYVEGTYPGMGVSAEIVIEDSGDGLLVPVSAVQTSGDTKYVYLAPNGASLGEIFEEGDIDVSKLTKVTVTEGMSDGSYIMIESDDLRDGDLIVVITKTSSLTGSENAGSEGGRGEFPGGMEGFGGGSFPGNMPEGFDPSQMPGGFPGGFGGFGG